MPGIGERGQAAIRRADASIEGHGLAAEVCALYLIGAGMRAVEIDARLEASCKGRNSDVEVVARSAPEEVPGEDPGHLAVRLSDGLDERAYTPDHTAPDDPVLRGSQAARWVLARILARAQREGRSPDRAEVESGAAHAK